MRSLLHILRFLLGKVDLYMPLTLILIAPPLIKLLEQWL